MAAWVAAIGCGFTWVARYEFRSGPAAVSPAWPVGSRVPLDHRLPTLLLFAHPRCPCTRATLSELARLDAAAPGRARIIVLFWRPTGQGHPWGPSELWASAARIPDVRPEWDDAGAEARRFGAATSGQVLLFTPDGQLQFSGGITESRGHAGDNLGSDSVRAILTGNRSTVRSAPTYGCSLFDAPPASGTGAPRAPQGGGY